MRRKKKDKTRKIQDEIIIEEYSVSTIVSKSSQYNTSLDVIEDISSHLEMETDQEEISDEEIESEAESDTEVEEVEESEEANTAPVKQRINNIEEILFKLPVVKDPFFGTPKQVQDELDELVIKMQKRPNSKNNENVFNKIHLYMHNYLLNVVLKQFPYIRGLQTNDIYQESLIAIRFKAIPGFKKGKGMSFLNFAKMCIRRHLITLLNASNNRLKDRSINQSVSLDSSYGTNDEDGGTNTLANVIADKTETVDVTTESNEALQITRKTLLNDLSDFEKIVLNEYLSNSSYNEIAKNPDVVKYLKKNSKKRPTIKKIEKAVDNALLRIRKKAAVLKKRSGKDDLPIFIK